MCSWSTGMYDDDDELGSSSNISKGEASGRAMNSGDSNSSMAKSIEYAVWWSCVNAFDSQ